MAHVAHPERLSGTGRTLRADDERGRQEELRRIRESPETLSCTARGITSGEGIAEGRRASPLAHTDPSGYPRSHSRAPRMGYR